MVRNTSHKCLSIRRGYTNRVVLANDTGREQELLAARSTSAPGEQPPGIPPSGQAMLQSGKGLGLGLSHIHEGAYDAQVLRVDGP